MPQQRTDSQLAKDIVRLSSQLIHCPSTPDNRAAQGDCLTVVSDFARRAVPGASLKRLQFGGRSSLLISSGRTTTAPAVSLYGHIDVVAAQPEQFRAVVRAGKLYGRGASDMKGMLAAELVAFAQAVNIGIQKPISVLVVSDEETGGAWGAQRVVKEFGFRPGCIVVPDGGDNWRFVTGEKGVYWVECTFHGVPGHGSRPWLGRNAGEALMEGYRRLQRALPQPTSERERRASVNLGLLRGGESPNQILATAAMTLDIRYPANVSLARLRQTVRRALGPGVTIRELMTSTPWEQSPRQPAVKQFQNIIRQTTGVRQFESFVSAGGSDARYFAARGIPVIITKPACGGHHGDREWVSVRDLTRFARVCERFLVASII